MSTRKRKPKPAKRSKRRAGSTPRRRSATPRQPRSTSQPAAETRGTRNCTWIEKYCRVPEGKDVGQPARLRDWQRRDICRIYDNPAGTRTAIESFAKKNGKTSMASWLLLLHLCGPEAVCNTQLVSTAQALDQAATLYKLAAKTVRMSPELDDCLVCRDTLKEIACPELGTVYNALSADAKTKHGKSPVFAVHDELGQVKGPVSDLYNAVENAMSAHAAPLSVIISTQAPTDGDLLSILIDDGMKTHPDGSPTDPHVVVSLYAAPIDMDPFTEPALRAANPAFGDFQNATELLNQAAKAKRMPSQEPTFRNYQLNQRVEMKAPFVSRAVWSSNATPPLSDFRGLKVFGGLDLSETTDLCAFVVEAKVDALWHVKPTFWLPDEGLVDKAKTERVPYDLWHEQGYLATTPGRSIEYEWVAEYLYDVFCELTVEKIAFDRWNWKHLKPWLKKAGFAEADLEGAAAHFVQFGQGFASMSPALRELEGALLNGHLAHGGHPVLTMCAANAVVQSDPAGNRKLAKHKSRGRIDGMVALAMSHAMAMTQEEATSSVYDQLGRQSPPPPAATATTSADADPLAIDHAALADVGHPQFAEMARRFELRQQLYGDDA